MIEHIYNIQGVPLEFARFDISCDNEDNRIVFFAKSHGYRLQIIYHS